MRLSGVVVLVALAAAAFAIFAPPASTQYVQATNFQVSPNSQTAAAAEEAMCEEGSYEDRGIKISIQVPCSAVQGAQLSQGSPTAQQDQKLLSDAAAKKLGTQDECLNKSV